MVKSLKPQESNKVITALNVMTGIRFAGGIALGTMMAFGNVNPGIAAGLASGLIATDAESSLYKKTLSYPRFQKLLRIIPSKLGRLADPIADKVMILSVISGGLVGHVIPTLDGIAVLGSEAVTVAATALASARGNVPEVSRYGKAGLVARGSAVVTELTGAAIGSGDVHNALMYAGHGFVVSAVVLGALSCGNIVNDYVLHPPGDVVNDQPQ